MSISPQKKALSSPSHSPQRTETMANLEQMFLLIEGILPFEACLYYQVLPLSIEGSSLNLGMVNSDDTKAADYVRRQVSYINCSIVSRPISSDWHREILSKFLSHSAKNRQASQFSQPKSQAKSSPFEDQPTLVVGAPTEIIETPREQIKTSSKTAANNHQPSRGQPSPSLDPPIIETAQPIEQPVQAHSAESHTVEAPHTAEETHQAAAASRPPLTIELGEETSQKESLPSPSLVEDKKSEGTVPESRFDPNQSNPKELTQVLLKQLITQEGIGRLYLERQNAACRILWSKDGVVQSVFDNISSQLFQGVINELKRMMSLSLIPVRKPKQIEIERIHNQKRILLRFRVMPGDHGEEATLQILRGAALRFYQQQQMDNLGRDALSVAQDLQQRIDDLRAKAQRNLDVQDDTKQKTLPAIMNMLKQMEQQLNDIIQDAN